MITTTEATTDGSVPARASGNGPKSKLAEKVADRIVTDVIALGWPVGQILGSETELVDRYQVSRAVFREAVRLVEHQQVVRTRRGPGGGLVIVEPTVDAVINAVVLYLFRVGARLDELFEARIVIEELASGLAPGRTDQESLARLRAIADDAAAQLRKDPRVLHALLASITGNPALELFVDVLSRVTRLYSSGWHDFGPAVRGEAARAHARIAEAVVSGDSGLARHRMRTHLEAEADYVRKRRSTRQLLPDSVVVLGQLPNGKRAESVARSITKSVATDKLQPGQIVGTEPELIQREGVSRAVLREAVRLLEHHQIACMRRGPHGGLFVFEPTATAVTEVTALYLARRQMQIDNLAEARVGVEVAIAGLAAERIDDAGRIRIQAALEHEASTAESERFGIANDLHAAIAGVAGNRVLELMALVFIRLSRIYEVERLVPAARQEILAEVLRAHEAIAAAVDSGDRELAMRRMRQHMLALGAVMH